jgi:acyl carrier protein
MIPGEVVSLDALPRTVTGKVDRGALPETSGARSPGTPHLSPRTPREAEVAELVGELLGVDRVGVTDDFFELGGNSLQAARFVNRLRDAFGVDISLQSLFAAPTVRTVAASMENTHQDRLTRLERDLAHLSDDEVATLLAEQRALSTKDQRNHDEY